MLAGCASNPQNLAPVVTRDSERPAPPAAVRPLPPDPVIARPSSILSSGCGQARPAKVPSAIRVDGRQRHFLLVVPEDYSASVPHAVVFAFHGRTNSNRKARGYFRLERNASRPTLFVYPSGVQKGRSYSWANPGDPPLAQRDFALFDALLERLSAQYCVDRERVHVVGHSLGA